MSSETSAAFDRVDTNGSGTLDRDEVMAALGVLGLEDLDPAELDVVMGQVGCSLRPCCYCCRRR